MGTVDMAARAKELSARLTPEQQEHYTWVTRRNNVIAAGVRVPKSGIFGGKGRAEKAEKAA